MANKVEICGVNTSKLPVYKDEQMKAMMEKIKQGDMETRITVIDTRSDLWRVCR